MFKERNGIHDAVCGQKRRIRRLESRIRTQYIWICSDLRAAKNRQTALINRFAQGKRALFFTGIETSEKQNLVNFSEAVQAFLSDEKQASFESAPVWDNFQSALTVLFERSKQEQFVLILDEYPYLARCSPSFPSVLQMLIDRYKDSSKMFLILCGSSVSYIEDQVLSYQSPLYGRRTMQLKVESFDYFSSHLFMPELSCTDQAVLYGTLGGTPQYLQQIRDHQSVSENIQRMFLRKTSYLYEEPSNLLKQELREPAVYDAILEAVAHGSNKPNEIASRSGITATTLPKYLKSLIQLGLLRKDIPYGMQKSKKGIYVICDPFFSFWYKFIPRNTNAIERGLSTLAWKRIEPDLDTYMGAVFERICQDYMWRLLSQGNSPISFYDLGRWWGTDAQTRKQEEIDIVGSDGTSAFAAECKWKNEPTGKDVLDTLIRRAKLLPYTNIWLILFSKTGFTHSCIQAAREMSHVSLISFEDMVSQFDELNPKSPA